MITFNAALSPAGIVSALLGERSIAQYRHCPLGVSLSWTHIHYPMAGFIEIYATEVDAQAAVLRFMEGLDIVPWAADGSPEN